MNNSKVEELLEDALNGNPAGNTDPNNQPQNKDVNNKSDEAKTTLPKYKVGNRELEPDQLHQEYENLLADYTRKSQRLSDLEKKADAFKDNNDGDKPLEMSGQDKVILKELKRLGFVSKDELESTLSDKSVEITRRASSVAATQMELKEAISQLEDDFDGSDGKPKVDGNKVLSFIAKYPETDMSPMQIAKYLYSDDFVKFEARGSAKSELPSTEDSGSGTKEPPKRNYKFNDGSAEAAVRDLIK